MLKNVQFPHWILVLFLLKRFRIGNSTLKFSVLDHQSSGKISPSGVVSITPNEDLKLARMYDAMQIMKLLNMNINVLIYSATFGQK